VTPATMQTIIYCPKLEEEMKTVAQAMVEQALAYISTTLVKVGLREGLG